MNKIYKSNASVDTLINPPFHIEAYRSSQGLCITVSGIVGLSEYSDAYIELLSHGGRICFSGKLIRLKLLESGSVEIVGKITEVMFKYGKN